MECETGTTIEITHSQLDFWGLALGYSQPLVPLPLPGPIECCRDAIPRRQQPAARRSPLPISTLMFGNSAPCWGPIRGQTRVRLPTSSKWLMFNLHGLVVLALSAANFRFERYNNFRPQKCSQLNDKKRKKRRTRARKRKCVSGQKPFQCLQ